MKSPKELALLGVSGGLPTGQLQSLTLRLVEARQTLWLEIWEAPEKGGEGEIIADLPAVQVAAWLNDNIRRVRKQ